MTIAGDMVTKHKNLSRTIRTIMTGLVLLAFVAPAGADQFDAQIAALKAQADAARATANQFGAQANDYQAKVGQLNAQINALQAQINLNQAKSSKLASDIAANTQALAAKQDLLDENLRTLYQQGQASTLEMLVSSNGIGDYLDRQQSLQDVKNDIEDSVATIKALKAKLQADQKEVDGLLADQRSQQQDIASQRNEVNSLLAVAEQSQNAANQQVANNNAQISKLRAQQAAAIAASSRKIGGGSGCGGYPASWCNAGQDTIVDSWGMYNRECVSYAAWATADRFGHNMPYWGGRGNANQWPGDADAAGIPRDGSPRVGDVGIYMGGPYGHAVIVEQVKSSTVIVSSFNSDNTGHYSVDEWPTSALTFIHFR